MVFSIVSELPGNLALSGIVKKVSLCSVSCPFVFGSTRCHNVTGARKAFFGCVFTSEHASFLRGSTKVLSPSKAFTGISSQIRTKLPDWAVLPVRAGCCSGTALSSNDSKTRYLET